MTTGIEVAVTPLVVNIEVADPSKVGEAGATPVSAEINNDNKLDFLMSDGRHIVVDDYLFTRGSEANYDSVLILSASRVVKQVDNVVSYASSDDDNSAYTTIGITRTAGTTVTVVKTGELVDTSFSFTANEPLFLNTNGFFSHTPPSSGFILQVGVALSTTKMLVDIGEPLFI
jgi:hypothetical protein